MELQLRSIFQGILWRPKYFAAESRLGCYQSQIGVGVVDVVLVHGGCLRRRRWRAMQTISTQCLYRQARAMPCRYWCQSSVRSRMGHQRCEWWIGMWASVIIVSTAVQDFTNTIVQSLTLNHSLWVGPMTQTYTAGTLSTIRKVHLEYARKPIRWTLQR